MKQSARLDYFRATTVSNSLIADQAIGYFGTDVEEAKVPLYGYKRTLKHTQSGAYYCYQPHTSTMGNLVQFSGSPITALMEASARGSIQSLVQAGFSKWKATRIDVAIDHFEATCLPEEFNTRLAAGEGKTRIRSWERKKFVVGSGIDCTYGGGLDSEKSIKIYDKAAEQGVEGVWTRYEMTFMGKRAEEVWNKVQSLPNEEALLELAKGLLKSMIDFPDWLEWQEAFGLLSKHEWTEIPRTESDKWRWLMKQVAPTFREAFEKEGDWKMLEAFLEAVKNG